MKEFLSQKGVKYADYNVSVDKVKLEEMVKIADSLAVPVITIDGKVLKGFNRKKIESLLGEQ